MDQAVSSAEFLVETFLPSLLPSLKKNPDAILEYLFAFEFIKGFFRLKELFLSPNLILFEDPDMNKVNIQGIDAPPGVDKYSFEPEQQRKGKQKKNSQAQDQDTGSTQILIIFIGAKGEWYRLCWRYTESLMF